jgi:hypothetical protein
VSTLDSKHPALSRLLKTSDKGNRCHGRRTCLKESWLGNGLPPWSCLRASPPFLPRTVSHERLQHHKNRQWFKTLGSTHFLLFVSEGFLYHSVLASFPQIGSPRKITEIAWWSHGFTVNQMCSCSIFVLTTTLMKVKLKNELRKKAFFWKTETAPESPSIKSSA